MKYILIMSLLFAGCSYKQTMGTCISYLEDNVKLPKDIIEIAKNNVFMRYKIDSYYFGKCGQNNYDEKAALKEINDEIARREQK